MALSFVGYNSASGNSADLNISLTALTGGSGSTALEGDIVIAANGIVTNAGGVAGITTSGYTSIVAVSVVDTNRTGLAVAYKVMGATPDTTVTVKGSGDATRAANGVVHVWRNINSTPIDVTTTTATGTNSGVPNPPSITPTTSGAIVVVVGASAQNSGGTPSAPTGYTNLKGSSSDPGGTAGLLGIASKAWTSGAEDPGTFGGFESHTADSWCAASIALRPAADASSSKLALLGVG